MIYLDLFINEGIIYRFYLLFYNSFILIIMIIYKL